MNAEARIQTRDGLISALKPGLLPKAKPTLLRDVLRMKRARGDADADQFKTLARLEFASRLDATIEGAAWALRQWIAKAEKLGWSDVQQARAEAMLADLDRVLAGDLTGWAIVKTEAA
ncbi:hypothetical protein [Aquamicrobium sp. LC103]|uniref:hypothetical protein n=1 Tax=Aquamicrobium sp. LC103 TaxID=1120658 RepID=UPI00063E9ACA|nr:hypothetical protein [Aquamicrobium sp. LC103]TKT80020.1 hypothetical protein XW59_006575 [Aquamicrobium sp. LC103]